MEIRLILLSGYSARVEAENSQTARKYFAKFEEIREKINGKFVDNKKVL